MFYRSFGFTEVTKNAKHTFVSHNGNMDNTEQNVRENFDAMYFAGAYDLLKDNRFARAFGSPDYSFSLRVPNSVFDAIIG
jgi:hypothetical protein